MIELKSSIQRSFSKDELEQIRAFGTLLGDLINNPGGRARKSRKRAKEEPDALERREIRQMDSSEGALRKVKELLDGCVGSDVLATDVGNRRQLHIRSEALDEIRAIVDVGLDIHKSPRVSRHHVHILVGVRNALKEYTRTIEALIAATTKTRKLVLEFSKLVGVAALPALALHAELSSALRVAVTAVDDVIAAVGVAFGL